MNMHAHVPFNTCEYNHRDASKKHKNPYATPSNVKRRIVLGRVSMTRFAEWCLIVSEYSRTQI